MGGFPDGLLLIVAGGVWEPSVVPGTGALVEPMAKSRTRLNVLLHFACLLYRNGVFTKVEAQQAEYCLT